MPRMMYGESDSPCTSSAPPRGFAVGITCVRLQSGALVRGSELLPAQ